MKRIATIVSCIALACVTLSAQDVKYEWSTDPVDGHRTGVVASSASNVSEAMGVVKGKKYYSPSGKVFRRGSTPKVAKIMIDAQPAMAVNKQVIGTSPRVMASGYPECALHDWFIDELMRAVQDSTGKKVDIGFANRGGVRTDMPEGDVFYDDIMSMFPFKNRICRVALRGRSIRALIERMNARSFQIIGGAKIVIKDGKVISVKVDGEPLDDEKALRSRHD
jgi:5''-nucleotidase/2'',3''-cyclic phosphodiesterase and related esterases